MSTSSVDAVPQTLFFAKEDEIPNIMAQEDQEDNTPPSVPDTPSQLGSPADLWSSQISSAPKSIGSLHLSDGASRLSESLDSDDDNQSRTQQAMISSDGVEHQLIMPSLTMPDRRPFTERGKNMGRLKILVAGRKGKYHHHHHHHLAASCSLLTMSRLWQIKSDQVNRPTV
jgi:hypothetical protein